MLINPTKKSLPIFNQMPKFEDKDAAKAFSEGNPFFSWHANYFNVKRKKVIVLVNDLTYSPVILADINAQNKKYLAAFIEEGIRLVFGFSGISSQKIDQYFELAGNFQINAGHNRKVTGVTNNYLFFAQQERIDLNHILQPDVNEWLAEVPFSGLPDFNSLESVSKVFEQALHLNEIKKQRQIKSKVLEKTWQPFSSLKIYELEMKIDQIIEIEEEHLNNNQLVIAAFSSYLLHTEKNSQRTVNKHLENVRLFLDGFLLGREMRTPITDLRDVTDFIGDWFIRKISDSPTQVKKLGTSMKKFYTFLAAADEVTDAQLKTVKEYIADGIELGLEMLEMSNDFDDYF